ncbi:hypothetical protein A2U01_0070894, partial [Trifolium medium]|nr:hypothetical protein [Trifolium medium]
AAAQVIQVPMGTGTEFSANQLRAHQVLPRDAVPQKSQGDPKDAYQGSRTPNVGPGENHATSQNGETHQKFKAIEDKLRVIESFSLHNVSPYSQHLAAAQHQ